MDNKKLADLLYPDAKNIDFWFQKFKPRNLPQGAEVTRFAPSPTGFLHIGGLFGAFIDATVAKQTGGVCFLRIEDTDEKRKIKNGVEGIINGFKAFDVGFDEGKLSIDGDVGDYGPYVQSERKEIYKSFAKEMVLRGKAYPCFCSTDELSELRSKQEAKKQNPGYYGEYAKCRNLSLEQIEENLKQGKPWVLRFKCPYAEGDKMATNDIVRGQRVIPCNFNDAIIMKSNGLPPYNFAHVVDDTLMHTTLVVRGDEWLPSLTEHLQLFEALGLTPPKYAHTSVMQKIDEKTNERRKISKRKDPESNVQWFVEQGYPSQAVFDYLMIIANSNFEDWRAKNPKANIKEFKFDISKLNTSGALFDMVKLSDVSKNTISTMTAQQVFDQTSEWAKQFDPEFYKLLTENKDYYIKILDIDRNIPKPRKDISHWAEVQTMYQYMFDDSFEQLDFVFPEKFSTEQIAQVLQVYPQFFNPQDDQPQWFDRIKDLAQSIGWAREVKQFKQEPERYPGHCGDVSTIIRVALTGRTMTPNLYDICMLLGKERLTSRLNKVLTKLKLTQK